MESMPKLASPFLTLIPAFKALGAHLPLVWANASPVTLSGAEAALNTNITQSPLERTTTEFRKYLNTNITKEMRDISTMKMIVQ